MTKEHVLNFPNNNPNNAQISAQAKALLLKGIENATPVVCTHCGCPFFERATTAKLISGLFTPTGKDALVLDDHAMVCKNCYNVLDASAKPEEKLNDGEANEAGREKTNDGN